MSERNIRKLVERKLNIELKKQKLPGTITVCSLRGGISLFYEKDDLRYFFSFPWKGDKTREPYGELYPYVFDPVDIVKHIKEKVLKKDTFYIA